MKIQDETFSFFKKRTQTFCLFLHFFKMVQMFKEKKIIFARSAFVYRTLDPDLDPLEMNLSLKKKHLQKGIKSVSEPHLLLLQI